MSASNIQPMSDPYREAKRRTQERDRRLEQLRCERCGLFPSMCTLLGCPVESPTGGEG